MLVCRLDLLNDLPELIEAVCAKQPVQMIRERRVRLGFPEGPSERLVLETLPDHHQRQGGAQFPQG